MNQCGHKVCSECLTFSIKSQKATRNLKTIDDYQCIVCRKRGVINNRLMKEKNLEKNIIF